MRGRPENLKNYSFARFDLFLKVCLSEYIYGFIGLRNVLKLFFLCLGGVAGTYVFLEGLAHAVFSLFIFFLYLSHLVN